MLSYTLNTDGLALCEKSKLTLTPVILVINKLPIEERFVIENVIIADNTRKQGKYNKRKKFIIFVYIFASHASL